MDETRVTELLPEEAKKPLTDYQITMVARGLLRPSPGIAQRLAIELAAVRELACRRRRLAGRQGQLRGI